MSIRELPDGWQIAACHKGIRVRKKFSKVTHPNRKSAERQELEMVECIETHGTWPEPGTIPVPVELDCGETIQDAFDRCWSIGVKGIRKHRPWQQTDRRDGYGRAAKSSFERHIKPFFMGLASRGILARITESDTASFVAWLKTQQLSNSSINSVVSVWEMMRKGAAQTPVLCATLPKAYGVERGRARTEWLNEAQEAALYDFYQRRALDEFAMVCRLMVYSGMIPSEIQKVRRSDIRFTDDGGVSIRVNLAEHGDGKTMARKRTIFGPVQLSEAVRFQLGRTAADIDRPWAYWGYANINRLWALYREHMGQNENKDFVPYMMRHTCATRLALMGVDIHTIKLYMGHSDYKTTSRYIQIADQENRKAAKAFTQVAVPCSVENPQNGVENFRPLYGSKNSMKADTKA